MDTKEMPVAALYGDVYRSEYTAMNLATVALEEQARDRGYKMGDPRPLFVAALDDLELTDTQGRFYNKQHFNVQDHREKLFMSLAATVLIDNSQPEEMFARVVDHLVAWIKAYRARTEAFRAAWLFLNTPKEYREALTLTPMQRQWVGWALQLDSGVSRNPYAMMVEFVMYHRSLYARALTQDSSDAASYPPVALGYLQGVFDNAIQDTAFFYQHIHATQEQGTYSGPALKPHVRLFSPFDDARHERLKNPRQPLILPDSHLGRNL